MASVADGESGGGSIGRCPLSDADDAVIAVDAVGGTPDDELPQPALDPKVETKQDEDAEDVSKGREGDIYAEAVLACSIENPESCVMCSG